MSSLTQHRGEVRSGAVELFLYLRHYVETPMRCNHCGTNWQGSERNCKGCGRFLCVVNRHAPGGDVMHPEKVWGWDESRAFPEYAGVKSQDDVSTVSNSWTLRDSEPIRIEGCKGDTPRLYRIWRKPVGMCGCWVGFKLGSKISYPDLSVPIGLEKLPKDAKALSDEESRRYWTM
jgi:hypothetical protein